MIALKRKIGAIVNYTPKQNKKQKTSPEPIDLLDSDSEDDSSDSTSTENECYDRIGVSKADHDQLLRKRIWLNDNMIDFYLKYLKEKYDTKDNVYLFNSLFFIKLQQTQRSSSQTKDYYSQAKSWFDKSNLNSKKIWLIPVCEGKHWYTIAIHKPTSNRPTMLIFDSLDKRGDVKYSAVDLVKSFINQKYKAEHSGKFRNFKILRLKNPQQANNNDCGLFALRNAEIIFSLDYSLVKAIELDRDWIEKNYSIYEQYPVPTRKNIYNVIQDTLQKNQQLNEKK